MTWWSMDRSPPLLLLTGRPFLCSSRLAWGSRTLAHAEVPLAEQAHLPSRVALFDHAVDEVLVLLLLVGAGLGIEADHREQFLGVREHLLLDHGTQLLVAGPKRVLARVVGPRPQHEVDDLVAE